MLYNLLAPLSEEGGIFNLFRYLTFRTGAAILFSLFLTMLLALTRKRFPGSQDV